MFRFFTALALSTFLMACGSSSNNSGSPNTPDSAKAKGKLGSLAADVAPRPMEFDWKIPCRVPVEQFSDKKGHKARLRYILTVKNGPEGNLDLDMTDFEFLELDGMDLTSPRMQAELAPALAITSALPTMIISREGEYLGMRDLESMIERVIKFMKKKSTNPDEEIKVAAVLRSPMMKQTLETQLGEYWNGWVGLWNGLAMAPLETRDGDDEIEFGEEVIPTRIHYENHGPVAGAPELVKVSFSSTISGNSASQGVLAFLRLMGREGGMPFPENIEIDHLAATTTFEAETDPRTLLPRHTKRVKKTEIVIKGERMKRLDVREETFDWAHAQGCR
jgi:hypothetical protein